jgi:hypothetical protein
MNKPLLPLRGISPGGGEKTDSKVDFLPPWGGVAEGRGGFKSPRIPTSFSVPKAEVGILIIKENF